MKKERVRSKHGFGGIAKFLLGCLTGFIIALLAVGGIGFWAYNSLTVRKVEKLIKSDITSNSAVEELTIKKIVAIAKGISSNNKDGYTIAKFEDDFNIVLIDDDNAPFGIDMSIIKNAPIKEISKAVDDTIDTITFNNVLKFLDVDSADIGILSTALEKTTTYYIYNGKLFSNPEHTIEVGFKYTIEDSIVKFANGAHTITSDTIKPRLMDLPLNTAITKFSDTTKALKISEILDYKYDDVTEKYYEKYENGNYLGEVNGLMNAIAGYTIDDLADQSIINDLKVCEVLGYYYNEGDGNYYTSPSFSKETKVAGVINAIAGNTVGDLSKPQTYNNLYVYQVMGYTYEDGKYLYEDGTEDGTEVKGVMALLVDATVSQIPDRVNQIINENTIYNLIEKEVIVLDQNVTLDNDTVTFFSSYTIPELVKFINDNIDILKALP